MKKILSIIGFICLTLFIVSCDKDTEGISFETNYAVFNFEGNRTVFHELGEPFVDPGTTATENGNDVEVSTIVTGTYTDYQGTDVDVNTADLYNIIYSATNSDGFVANETRNVYVVNTSDLVNSIEGLYTSTVVRNGSSSAQYTDMEYILISKVGDNQYKLSCGIGGYYQIGRGYGLDYSAPVVVTANDISANDFTAPTFGVGAFGGTATITSFSVDAASKTINFTTSWDAGYEFVVTLNQVQI